MENSLSLAAKLQPALFIARREVRDQFRDWRIIFPILGLTVFFPFLMNFTAQQALDFVAEYGATLIAERLIPFLFMIVGFFPISVSLVIALESFVGEKERGSIEPLLNTPLEDWQLYLGKLIAATIPPLLSSYLGMAVYLGGLLVSKVTIPDPVILLQLVALTSVQAIVMVAGAVIVSTQTTTVRAANLLASFIVIPSALLIQGESIMVFWGNYSTLWWAVFGMALFGLLLVRVGMAHFRREELLGKEIDVLNFRWGWGVFKSEFIDNARHFGDWYKSVFRSLKKLLFPISAMVILLLIAVYLGQQFSHQYLLPLERSGLQNLDQRMGEVFKIWPAFSFKPILAIFWQNLRVLLLALPLGMISLGVFGVLPVFASLGVVGYLMGLLQQAGISPWLYLVGFILPHGLFEIPAAIICSAAILRMGAAMATPDPSKPVSEVLLRLLAEWAKIMLAIVIPLLIIASIVEVWVTPRIALYFFG